MRQKDHPLDASAQRKPSFRKHRKEGLFEIRKL